MSEWMGHLPGLKKKSPLCLRNALKPQPQAGGPGPGPSPPQDGCFRGEGRSRPLIAEDTSVHALSFSPPILPPEDSDMLSFSSRTSTWPCPSATPQSRKFPAKARPAFGGRLAAVWGWRLSACPEQMQADSGLLWELSSNVLLAWCLALAGQNRIPGQME